MYEYDLQLAKMEAQMTAWTAKLWSNEHLYNMHWI
jgi:hypothetical protein